MATILSREELRRYVEKVAQEIAYDFPELLDAYYEGSTTKERVIENVVRKVETAIQATDDSLGRVEEIEEQWR